MAWWHHNHRTWTSQDLAKYPWGRGPKGPLKLALGLKRTFILIERSPCFHLSGCLPSWIAPQFGSASLSENATEDNTHFLSQVKLASIKKPISETTPTQQWTDGRFGRGQVKLELASTDANATLGFHCLLSSRPALIALQTWATWTVVFELCLVTIFKTSRMRNPLYKFTLHHCLWSFRKPRKSFEYFIS